MMVRLIVLVVLAAAAVAVALILQRRRPDPPTAPSYRAPIQLDRNDFADPDKTFLAVVFASTTCNSCPDVWATIEALETPFLAVQRIDVQDQSDLHKRYKIDGVPTTVFANASGVVTNAFFGPLEADSLRDVLTGMGPDQN